MSIINDQLRLFPNNADLYDIAETVLPTEEEKEISVPIAESMMVSAIEGTTSVVTTPQDLNNRAQTFLLGVQLNRMDTIRKLLSRIEPVEMAMTRPDMIENLHPEFLVKIYEALNKNLDTQIKSLTQVKETITESVNVFNTQINQGVSPPESFDPFKVVSPESREKIRNVLKGLVNMQDVIDNGTLDGSLPEDAR